MIIIFENQHQRSFVADKTEVEVVQEAETYDLQERRSVQTTIKFEFIMDSLVIELFTGGSKMVFENVNNFPSFRNIITYTN